MKFMNIVIMVTAFVVSTSALASVAFECTGENVYVSAYAKDENNTTPAFGETTLEVSYYGLVVYYGDAVTRKEAGKLIFQTVNEEPNPVAAAVGLSKNGLKSKFVLFDLRGKTVIQDVDCVSPKVK